MLLAGGECCCRNRDCHQDTRLLKTLLPVLACVAHFDLIGFEYGELQQ
jgi:hypothetical protein